MRTSSASRRRLPPAPAAAVWRRLALPTAIDEERRQVERPARARVGLGPDSASSGGCPDDDAAVRQAAKPLEQIERLDVQPPGSEAAHVSGAYRRPSVGPVESVHQPSDGRNDGAGSGADPLASPASRLAAVASAATARARASRARIGIVIKYGAQAVRDPSRNPTATNALCQRQQRRGGVTRTSSRRGPSTSANG